ncbi:heavy-metal-associated domain-containing protein [Gaetbulibacter aestuarii]|uniref:Heavy metal-associated domain-containing protein n=1 Tax=Gaetbulibacter aestuarii TaxID=1502358 RepID=A0ABW7MVT9_9FLAO
MTSIKTIFGAALILVAASSCKNKVAPEVKTIDNQATAQVSKEAQIANPNAHFAKAEFTINGMTCAMGCAAVIQNHLSNMDGVKSAKVDFDKKLAMVEYDDAKVNAELLTKTVSSVGKQYEVADMKTVDTFSEKE